MTKERELAEAAAQQKYFESVAVPSSEHDEGTRELGELYPFLISGGTNTERYYFTHINDKTEIENGIVTRVINDYNYRLIYDKNGKHTLGKYKIDNNLYKKNEY